MAGATARCKACRSVHANRRRAFDGAGNKRSPVRVPEAAAEISGYEIHLHAGPQSRGEAPARLGRGPVAAARASTATERNSSPRLPDILPRIRTQGKRSSAQNRFTLDHGKEN